MFRAPTLLDDRCEDTDPSGTDRERRPPGIRHLVGLFGALNVAGGLLGLLGPAVWENDDGGFVNWETGRFLGLVVVNGPHATLHLLTGVLGLRAASDAGSARRYVGLVTAFFGAMAATGWQRFGFDPGVHEMGPVALDRWANVGHALVALLGAWTLLRSGSES
jgi:hypothetical protein